MKHEMHFSKGIMYSRKYLKCVHILRLILCIISRLCFIQTKEIVKGSLLFFNKFVIPYLK